MLIEYIERLRRQPLEVRQKAVTFWTIIIVGIIVVLYGLYLLVSTFMPPVSVVPQSGLTAPYSE